MYSSVLTKKINELALVQSWASLCNHGAVRDHIAIAVSLLKDVRNEVLRSEDAAASRDEQARNACKCGKGRCGI
jgi:hypothetical protein